MRYFLFLFFLIFSTQSFSAWDMRGTDTEWADTGPEACAATQPSIDDFLNSQSLIGVPKYVTSPLIGEHEWNGDFYCRRTVYYWNDPSTSPDLTGIDVPVYDLQYTDEQCQAQYGTASVPAASDGGMPDSFDTGACLLTPKAGVGACFPKTGQCTGDFTATSTGNTNTPGGTGASAPETPDYLTETTDPDSCPAGSVSYGGTSYCVDQSAIDDGSISIIGGDDSGSDGGSSGGIDWGDSPDDGSTPGTSTGSDGDPLGMGQGDPDGDGQGDSTQGDVVGAINDLKDTVRNGFDGIYEKTVQFVEDLSAGPSQAAIEGEFGTAAENQTAMEAAITEAGGELTSLIDGSDSQFTAAYDTMGSFFGTYFPTIPEPSCSPLVFAAGEPYSFTIECDVFQLIREALAWILYAFTVYVIIATMFSARPH